MRDSLQICWVLVLTSTLTAFSKAPPPSDRKSRFVIPLNTKWQFQKAGEETWHPAEVPGCVHTDLLKNKLIDDPFYRDNAEKLQWIGKTFWKYQTRFSLEPQILQYENIELVFEGLDTYATVSLNEVPLLSTDNMFRQWRVHCKKALRDGPNILSIHFSSPISKVLPALRSRTVQLPAPMDSGEKTSPYTRKAPFQYGWNWAPRLVTCGIWKPVILEAWDQVRIADFHILQKQITSKAAKLNAEIELESRAEVEAKIVMDCPTAKIEAPELQLRLKPGKNQAWLEAVVPNPALWWPNGLGEQPLYTLRARLWLNSKPVDQVTTRIGLRSLELEQKSDLWGKSFQFVINGVPLFAKGGNWIPADSFPSRVSRERYRHLIQSCRDANMNMLRVWGGGIYESQEFYDLCDEMGLLVWQDFIFANSLYPADRSFIDNIKQEAIDNLKRLRNHPSLAIWCGNNEVESGWFHWGWKKYFPASLWDDYKRIFHDLLPDLCKTYDPSRPYWPSSPSSNLEDDPDSQKVGDFHYWDVWNRGIPPQAFENQFPRFMSEYGFQSFPELKTVSAFAPPEEYHLQSPVMLAHQKYPAGNTIIVEAIRINYPAPKDFESFLYVSQVLQAEVVKMAAEHLRRIMPRSMGSLYWQINDCWPATSLSSIDYFGRWKPLHYFAREFYKDLLVSPHEENGMINIYIVSDRLRVTPALLNVTLMDFDGHTILESRKPVGIEPSKSGIYLRLPKNELLQARDPKKVFLNCELWVSGKLISSNLNFFDVVKNLSLPLPRIKVEFSRHRDGFTITLTSGQFAKYVYLSLDQYEGSFSNNYFDLLPGKKVEVELETSSQLEIKDLAQKVKIRSLADAF